MKLLFDENLSPSLAGLIGKPFPGSTHLRDVGLKGASDAQVWDYAAAHDFVIATKDDDFRELSVLRGAPPKVVMIVLGNCSTADLEQLLRIRASAIEAFGADPTTSLLQLG